jgi:hypothetical protein
VHREPAWPGVGFFQQPLKEQDLHGRPTACQARPAEDRGSKCLRRVVSVPHTYQKCAGERPEIRTGESVLQLLQKSALCDCEV